MYAIEFESKINNGILKIPKHYKRILQSDKAKVIIMIENQEDVKKKSKESIFNNFLKMSQNVNNLENYSRDDLHDR